MEETETGRAFREFMERWDERPLRCECGSERFRQIATGYQCAECGRSHEEAVAHYRRELRQRDDERESAPTRLDGELHFVLDRPPSEGRDDSSPLSRDIVVELKPV